MRTHITSALVALAVCTSATAFADHHHHRDRVRAVHMRTPSVRVYRYDTRPQVQIEADPRFHIAIRGYRPHHHWGRYHLGRAWMGTWRVSSWNDVSTITCEAVDRDTGRRYPVSATRGDASWRDSSADAILDQALDECYADGGGAACVPVQPACMVQQ